MTKEKPELLIIHYSECSAVFNSPMLQNLILFVNDVIEFQINLKKSGIVGSSFGDNKINLGISPAPGPLI